MEELKGSSPLPPESLGDILKGVRADQAKAVRGALGPEKKPLTPTGPDITSAGVGVGGPPRPSGPGEGAAEWQVPSWLGPGEDDLGEVVDSPPTPGQRAAGRVQFFDGAEAPDIGPNPIAPDAFVRSGQESFWFPKRERPSKRFGRWLKDTFWSKEDMRANLLTSGGIALIRAGINWGTGGLGLAGSMGVGAVAGGIRAGVQEVYREFGKQNERLNQRTKEAEDAGVDWNPDDIRKWSEADDTRFYDLIKKYRTLENKGQVAKAAVRGAAYGALGGALGFEIKELGIADFIHKAFTSEHGIVRTATVAGSSITGALAGFAGERTMALRERDKLPFPARMTTRARRLSKRTAMMAVLGAVAGFAIGEVGTELMGFGPDIEMPKPEAPAAVPTATIPQVETPKPAVVPGSPPPSPEVPRAVVSPEPSPTAIPPATATPTETRVPPTRVPPTSTPVPRPTLPPGMNIQPSNELLGGMGRPDLGDNNIQDIAYRIKSPTSLQPLIDDPNRQYPQEIVDRYDAFRNSLPADKKQELLDLFKTTPSSDTPIAFPTEEVNSPVADYPSLRGKLQALYADHLIKPLYQDLKDLDLDSPNSTVRIDKFLSDHNLKKEDFVGNLEESLKELKNNDGKINPFNGDHLILRDMMMQQQGINPKEASNVIDATYAFAKRATPAVNFSPNHPDFINRNLGVFVPKDLDEWFDNVEDIAKKAA